MGADNIRGDQLLRYLATVGWLVIIIAGMRAAESILVPLLLSIFLAVITAPLVLWFQRKGLHVALAVGIVIAGGIAIGMGIGALVGTSLQQFSQALPRYQAHLQQEMTAFLSWLQGTGAKISPEEIAKFIDPGAAMRLGAKMLSGLGEMLANTFLILLTVTFILFEASSFPSKLKAIWGDPNMTLGPFSKILENVNHFLAIKTMVSLGTGIAVAIWVGLLGVDFPLLWGLLAFLLNYVPNLGSIIAAAPPVLLGFIQFGLGRAILIAFGCVLANLIFGNIIEPRLMGKKMGLSTLAVFLSLVLWGWVWGPVGMILSVPLTMVLKIVLENYDDTRWIAILIGTKVNREHVDVAPVES